MSVLDKRCLLSLETINSYHSAVEFSQTSSNEYSSLAKAHAVKDYPKGLAKAPIVRDYPKGCGKQIHTKEKDSNNNEEENGNVAINDTKNEEKNNFLIGRKLEQSKDISFENCMSTRMDSCITSNFMETKSSTTAFPSILMDFHALKQRNEYQPNAATFNQMKASHKILDNFKKTNNKNSVEFHKLAASKVNSSDNVVASTLQKNNVTIDKVANIEPELQTIKKEVEELTSKKKRKIESQYEIMVTKKREIFLLVDNNNSRNVSINFKSDDNKVSNALQLFRAIYNRIPSYNLAYNEFVGKYGRSNQGIIGKIPGVEIGDEFYFRAEMCIVGLHCQLVAGIDYVKLHGKKFANSIVSSNRQYSNKKCGSDVLMYSGTRGTFDKDQKFEGRNLALKNSIEDKIPIRVIHGLTRSCKKKYVYDGLYLAEKYTIEDCKLMFQLRRIPGQAEIDIRGLEIVQRLRLPNLPSYDISDGKEDKPIKVHDTNDDLKKKKCHCGSFKCNGWLY